MKTYSVKDVSDMLDTNPETVRRWIRSGKLKADQTSRKDGNTIREADLYKFLRVTSKYSGVAAGMVAANPLLALTTAVATSVLGIVVTARAKKKAKGGQDVEVLSGDVELALKTSISESKEIIRRKQAAIAELQAEIDKEKQHIREYETAIKHLSEALASIGESES